MPKCNCELRLSSVHCPKYEREYLIFISHVHISPQVVLWVFLPFLMPSLTVINRHLICCAMQTMNHVLKTYLRQLSIIYASALWQDLMIQKIVEACPSLLYLNLSCTLVKNATLKHLSRYTLKVPSLCFHISLALGLQHNYDKIFPGLMLILFGFLPLSLQKPHLFMFCCEPLLASTLLCNQCGHWVFRTTNIAFKTF